MNADVLLGTPEVVLNHNVFAYCNGNPIRYADSDGKSVDDVQNAEEGSILFVLRNTGNLAIDAYVNPGDKRTLYSIPVGSSVTKISSDTGTGRTFVQVDVEGGPTNCFYVATSKLGVNDPEVSPLDVQVKYGSVGPIAKIWQDLLGVSPYEADGFFWDESLKVLKDYQKANGIQDIDKKNKKRCIGPNTRNTMKKELDSLVGKRVTRLVGRGGMRNVRA